MKIRKILFVCISIFCIQFCIAQKSLSKDQAIQLSEQYYKSKLASIKPNAEIAWKNHEIKFGDKTARLGWRLLKTSSDGKRNLYISLHGGGNTEPSVNDQQWYNQIQLYLPKDGFYVAPRAPTNTWNLWHEDHIDNIFDSLIRYSIIMENVDPNRVYLMGYSAGGDGVFQMAPRMADRWAAASMMAGHPGDADLRNLRNLPFDIFVGGQDAAYDRNKLAAEKGHYLDSLHAQDPQGYIHDLHVYAEHGHWMERKDTISLPWMEQFKRNPNPDKVVWYEDDRLQNRFYWLQLPNLNNVKQKDSAIVSIHENTIQIEGNSFPELYINLNDHIVDLNKRIVVKMNNKIVFKGKLNRSEKIIAETSNVYIDPDMIYSARIIVKGNDVKRGL